MTFFLSNLILLISFSGLFNLNFYFLNAIKILYIKFPMKTKTAKVFILKEAIQINQNCFLPVKSQHSCVCGMPKENHK